MDKGILGVVGLIIGSMIIYIISSGSNELSKQERLVCYIWIIFLIYLCNRLI